MERPVVDRWIKDNEFEPRYQFWTRANIGEVLPEPPTPLAWDVIWEHTILAGWRDLFVQRFGYPDDEIDPERAEVVGCFGGYGYLGAALFRVWAGRTPGMTPTTIDEAYFGDHPDVPPYVAEPWHENAKTSETMGGFLGWVTVGLDQSELNEDKAESLRIRASRPDFSSMSVQSLYGFMLAQRPVMRRIFHQHINQSVAASVGPGILGQICTAIGQPTWPLRLMSGMGGVDSAAPSYAMWDLSRRIRASTSLTALFNASTQGTHERLTALAKTDADAKQFASDLDAFIAEFGSRGANEWDLVAKVWELRPDTVLAAIDRMRLADDDASPQGETAKSEATRNELAAQVRAALAGNDEALGGFEVGFASAATFLPGRERSKTTNIRVLHEIRMAAIELGGRLVAQGLLSDPDDVFYVFLDELEELVAGYGQDLKAKIPNRIAYREWLKTLEPPFIINGHAKPNTSWSTRGSDEVAILQVGESIQGGPGCAGSATGRARVITDPTDPYALEPGDILVAPATDPSWTPLFVPAAGVVVDVGAALSHAVIVSRELGIPCVPAALHATRRIPDGATITVDGDTCTVTMIALP